MTKHTTAVQGGFLSGFICCVITEMTKLVSLVLYFYFKHDNILNVTSFGQFLSFFSFFFVHWTVVIFASCGLCNQNNSLCSAGGRILKVICNLLYYFL